MSHHHHHDGPALDERSLRGLSRRELMKRGGLAAGGMLLASGAAGFAPAPTGALRGPVGVAAGAQRRSRLAASAGTRLVHADMHNHTLLSDGDGKAMNAFELMRQRGLDVAALTDHASGDSVNPGDRDDCYEGSHSCGRGISLTAAGWHHVGELADAANDPANGFVAVRGFEWSATVQGHVNVWFTEEFTDPTLTGGQAGYTAVPGYASEEGGDNPVSAGLRGVGEQTPAPGMVGFYDWLAAAPSRPVLKGGLDGIAGFNHPGREPGRFGYFGHVDGASDRIVSVEVMNRSEDYLFQGVENGSRSPIMQCLDEGWRVGLLGVTDEHGDDAWGRDVNDTKKGRAGLWVREDLPYGRTAVKEAMTARRFFATNKSGLRLDLRATSLVTTESVRMGQTLAHRRGVVVLDVDIDGTNGEQWAGSKPLSLQVLRPSSDLLPAIVHEELFIVPAGRGTKKVALDVSVDDGDWLIVRLSDPTEGFHGEGAAATGTPYERLGRAVAYASPVYIDPDADASAEAMRREMIAGVR